MGREGLLTFYQTVHSSIHSTNVPEHYNRRSDAIPVFVLLYILEGHICAYVFCVAGHSAPAGEWREDRHLACGAMVRGLDNNLQVMRLH